jgi:transposase
MMGPRQVDQAPLFYEFSLERHVPAVHLLRAIDRFVDLSEVRSHLAPFYSSTGRPSIDPELLIRMLLVGYCYGIRSERRLCEEVHLNLAYRWFCRLGLDGEVPDHSTFSKNRHGRFRDCDLLRKLFETVVRRCMAEGLVDGAAFAVDASLIAAVPTSSALRPGLMMLTGRPSPGRADPSGNISIPWIRLPGAQPARRYRSSSPSQIRPHNGPALTKGMPSLPTPTTT